MPTAEIETESGETVTVDLNEHLADGQRIVSEEELKNQYVDKEYHEKEINRVKDRFDSDMRSDLREELKKDESFRKEVAAEYDLDEEERKEVVQQVEENKVKPALQEAETWREKFKQERIISALQDRDDIDPKALQSVGAADPMAVQALRDRVTVQNADDPSEAKVVMTDGNGNPMPGDDGGYASVSEGLDELAESDDYKPLFREEEPSSGSGFNGSGTPSKSADSWQDMSSDEVMDYVRSHGHHPREDAS